MYVMDVDTFMISIHALHEESDPYRFRETVPGTFQSTLSMRRATFSHDIINTPCQFQSTLSMRRATSEHHALFVRPDISIHALHEESDSKSSKQSTDSKEISIHALHEESDSAAGHFCPLFETQASCLALSISNNTADTTNNMSKTSNWLSVSF